MQTSESFFRIVTQGEARSSGSSNQLTNSILAAFDHACDLHNIGAAQDLLAIAQRIESDGVPGGDGEKQFCQQFVDAHFRLWELRCQIC